MRTSEKKREIEIHSLSEYRPYHSISNENICICLYVYMHVNMRVYVFGAYVVSFHFILYEEALQVHSLMAFHIISMRLIVTYYLIHIYIDWRTV